MDSMYTSGKLTLAALMGTALLAGTASADIINSAGQVTIVPTAPGSVQEGMYESDEGNFGFIEAMGFVLDQDMQVDISTSGMYLPDSTLTTDWLTAGTVIDSYFFHQDLVGNSIYKRGYMEYSITFDREVLGIIVLGDSGLNFGTTLDASDYIGEMTNGTVYAKNSDAKFRGSLDSVYQLPDIIELSADKMTINFAVGTRADYIDQIRVITRGAVPAPTSLALFGLGGLCVTHRRRRTI